MKKEKDASIFDSLSKKGPGKLKKKSPKIEKSSSSEIPQTNEYGDDVEKMLERMHYLRKDIKSKLDSVYENQNFSPVLKEIGKGMTGETKEKVDEERRKLENATWSALGYGAKHKKASKEMDKASKERKSKSLGSRRSWISMR